VESQPKTLEISVKRRFWRNAITGNHLAVENFFPADAGTYAFKKKFRCFSLIGIPSFSMAASMSSQTRRFSLIA